MIIQSNDNFLDEQCRSFEVKTESGNPVDRNQGKETKKLLRIKSQRGNVKVTRLDIQSCVDALNECQIEPVKMPIHVAVTDHTQPKVFQTRQSSIPLIIIVLSTLDIKTKLMIISQ